MCVKTRIVQIDLPTINCNIICRPSGLKSELVGSQAEACPWIFSCVWECSEQNVIVFVDHVV